jgi:hypothetical protein
MADLTTNKNYLAPVSFQVTIDRSQFANLEYFCNRFSLPSVDSSPVEVPFRNIKIKVPSDRPNYSEITMGYIVNENLDNYIELYNWVDDNIKNNEYTSADIILNVLSSHGNVVRQIQFIDCIPINIGQLEFDMTNEINYIVSDASFAYTKFEIIK